MSITRDHIEKGICLVWAVFLLQLISGPLRNEAFYNALIIVTSVLIPALWGWKWLKRYRVRWIAVGAGVYVLAISVSALVAGPVLEGLDTIRKFPAKGGLILFSILFLFRRKENWIWFMWGIAGSIVIALFLAYYNLVTPDAMNLTVNPTGEKFPGSLSILHYHKNEFASFLMFTVPLLSGFALLLVYRSGAASWSAWTFLGIVLAALPVVFLTKSRSAQATVPVCLAVPPLIIALKSGYWKTLVIGGITGLLVLVAMLFTTEPGQSVIDRWSQKSVMTMSGRTNRVWPRYYDKAMKRPYFGHGLNIDIPDSWVPHEHNLLLAHFTRTGLIGLAGFCVFLLLTLFTAVRRLYVDPITPEYLLFLAFLASVLSGVIMEGLVGTIRWPQIYMITLSGMIASGCMTVRNETLNQTTKDRS